MRSRSLYAFCLFVLAACGPEPEALRPVLGRWTSQDPRFEGCFMAFEQSGYLSLWNAASHSELCRIVEVDAEKDGVLVVTYETTEGTEDRLELELLEENRLRLGKQGSLWERK